MLQARDIRSPREALRSPAAKGPGRSGGGGGTMTTMQAGFNVVNLYIGMGLLSKPFAVAEGGWLSLVPLVLLCAIR
jgi:hypothetical protein